MQLRKRLLRESRLYVIIDRSIFKKQPIENFANTIQQSGVSLIQYRNKTQDKETVLAEALGIKKALDNKGALFIVNDYLDVAKIVDADGLHIGQSDVSLGLARKILGEEKIIGISCRTLKHAILAQGLGADYVGIGPIFPTCLKPEAKPIGLDILKELRRRLNIPFFAIGGINTQNLSKVISCGAKRVAVCRAALQRKNVSTAVRELLGQF